MKKLIVAICAIVVAITAVAQYSAVSYFGFQVCLEFNNYKGTVVEVNKFTDGRVLVRSQMKAEDVFSNLDNLSNFEVCSSPFASEEALYDYEADNLTDAVRLLIKAIRKS